MKNAMILLAFLLCFCTKSAGQQVPENIFSDDFESGFLNPAYWTAGPGPNGGLVEVQSGIGNASIFAVAMGRTFDGTLTTNTLDLRLNLQGRDEVEMTFWIWDYFDDTHAGDGLYFSANGGASFVKALDFKPSDWCDQYGQFPPVDVAGLAAEKGLALTSQFVIRFQQQGSYDFSGNSDGFIIDDVNVYDPNLSYASIPFCDDFETGNLSSYWAWRFADQTTTLTTFPTKPSNFAGVAAGTGYESIFAVNLGKRCDDGSVSNALDLHLNLQGQTQVEMTFWIWDYFDETHVDDGIYFSENGGETFKKVFNFKPGDWCDQYGQFPPIDVDSLAQQHSLNLTSKFIIRFQQYGSYDFSGNSDGLIIDDVCVYVPQLAYKTLPFCDDFETGQLGDAWAWRFADQTTTLTTFPTQPSNFTGVVAGSGYESIFAVSMGKRCDDGPVSNALDLHLNLQGQTQVEMTFLIWDYFDETHVDDGIYFSENGGETFKKVFNFKPGDWCEQYGQFPPIDVDSLAQQFNLNLTSKFIIRFQQYGSYDFSGNSDGLIIDNVCVYVPQLAYKTLPFCDDFETGQLGDAWAWRFADQTTTLATFPTKPSNFTGVVAGSGFESNFAVAMGKRCDDGPVSNALDLHLNLQGQTQVELTFYLWDYFDETHVDDGIYFSNNGGETFEKAFSFDPGSTPETYQFFSLDVDALAASKGLGMTSDFIIRFQQYGSFDFSGNSDGFVLDNVCVNGDNPNAVSGWSSRESGIKVFPNPVQSALHIMLDETLPDFSSISFHDAGGRLLNEYPLGEGIRSFEWEVSHLADGFYFIRLKGEHGAISHKFVKTSR